MAKNFHINTFSLDQSENGTAPARPLPPPREIRVKRTPIKLKHKFFLFSEKRFRKLWNTNRSLNWITAPEEAKKISVILFEISSLFCCILQINSLYFPLFLYQTVTQIQEQYLLFELFKAFDQSLNGFYFFQIPLCVRNIF